MAKATNANLGSVAPVNATPSISTHPLYVFDTERIPLQKSFEQELAELINKHCKEAESNTPDFILAHYLHSCLFAFTEASRQRERWYGKSLSVNIDNEPDRLHPDTVVTDIGNNLDTRG